MTVDDPKDAARAAESYVLFALGGQTYGLEAARVVEIARTVAVSPLPAAPPLVEGALDWRGLVVALLDFRGRFRLPKRAPQLSDHLILAQARGRLVALRVDEVRDVVELPLSAVQPPGAELDDVGFVAGIARGDDGLILIHDLDSFLSDAEHDAVARALEAAK